MISIFYVGDGADYYALGKLLSEVHHVDYKLTLCDDIDGLPGEILSGQHDVVLLDYYWGHPNAGRDLLIAARSQGCEIPILVMTDDMEADVDREAIKVGASDYLIKGRIDSQLLERTIRYAIERKTYERQLAKLAHYDPLTDVANRVLFRDRLEHAVRLADRGAMTITLMYIDLDGFKPINDQYGHVVGDLLLTSVAKRLCACIRRSDMAARIGGDEFTILLEHTEDTPDIVNVAEKIVASINEPHRIGERTISVGCSIGIAVYPYAGRTAEALQANADLAMYKAKQEPGTTYRFFTDAMNITAQRQSLLINELREAVGRRALSIQYFPRIDLSNMQLRELIAQLSWYHPEHGWLAVDEHWHICENFNLSDSMCHWFSQQLSFDLKQLWQQRRDIVLCLPLTANLMSNQLFVKSINELALSYALAVECEEQILYAQPEIAEQWLRDKAGEFSGFGLTHFGEKQSYLTLLQKFSITHLVVDVGVLDDAKINFLKGLNAFCEKLKLRLIANNVVNLQDKTTLSALGLSQAQGPLFGSGYSINEFLKPTKKLALDNVD